MSPAQPDVSEMSHRELTDRSSAWGQRLLEGTVNWMPVRHHSPACAMHVARWIELKRPEVIIVEGPCSFDRWITPLCDPDCVPPVAILATYRESNDPLARRHSSFYPLCQYSPEWIAITHGTRSGGRVRFADLDFASRVQSQQHRAEDPESILGGLISSDSQLQYSQFIRRLVQRSGCRDFDELWDHLFESSAENIDTFDFVGRLATYCDLSRASYQASQLRADATLARETVMLQVVREEIAMLGDQPRDGAILVVTGGFHTVALVQQIDQPQQQSDSEPIADVEEGQKDSWLIPYSYPQLDALSGYESGMPSPAFYDVLWSAGPGAPERRRVVADLICQIARRTRGASIGHEASVTDSIAALEMLDQLSDLRGHRSPTRSDLIDAVFSCMRKEAAGGDVLGKLVQNTLAGTTVGRLPESVHQPPIIADFRRQAKQFRLPLESIEPKNLHLELYRKPHHRPISFLLHQLAALEVSYGRYVDGPDFSRNFRADRLSEQWELMWSPAVEARLAEVAMMGDSIAGAAANQVLETIRRLDTEGAARSASVVVDLLVRSCRMGLQHHAQQITSTAIEHICEDCSFASLAVALSQLTLLRNSREPLEATRLENLDELIALCFEKLCHRIDQLADVPDDQLDASLDGLISTREFLAEATSEGQEALQCDPELFYAALEQLIQIRNTATRSEIAGAATGLLFGAGRLDSAGVSDIVQQYLNASIEDVGAACGVVRGMMATAREVFWRVSGVLSELDALFSRWQQERFHAALPHLRLAFSSLTPKEVDAMAGAVASLHNQEDLGDFINPDITEEDLSLGLRVADIMNRSLKEDGLL